MCGIAGVLILNGKEPDRQLMPAMLEKMKHRGPDDKGTFREDNIELGHVRLSIIDLTSAGHQPMYSADERFVLTYNGEIYNYIELKDELKSDYHFTTETDSEVLLAAYITWGKDCLHRFNGMFAFTIYDRQEKTLFGARDRFGIKPFYYYKDEKQFVFASEIQPVLLALPNKPEPDDQSIFNYLVFNGIDQTERTFFKDVKKLNHGEHIVIENGQLTITRWYDLRKNLKEPFQNASEFKDLLSSACGLRLRSDVPIGVCLSGGLDSSSIVSLLTGDHQKKDLATFSAVYEKGLKADESPFIDELKASLNNMHFITPSADTLLDDLDLFVEAHGEPLPATSPYAQFKVMQLAKGKSVVLLDGQGADEHLAGYSYFFGFYFKELFGKFQWLRLFKEVFYYLKIHRSLFAMKTFLYFFLPNALKTKLRIIQKGYLLPEFLKRFTGYNVFSNEIYSSGKLQDALINHFEYKLEHLLKWEDRNSMWFSLESRVPFLDHRLVEKSLSLPSDKIIKDGMTKHILREAMKGLLPEKIRMRQDKMGFATPEDDWFKTERFQAMMKELLSSDSFKNRGYIDVKKASGLYARHLKGEINIPWEIWKWAHLELWFRKFID